MSLGSENSMYSLVRNILFLHFYWFIAWLFNNSMLCMCEEFTLINAKICSLINMQSNCSRPNVTIMLSPRCSDVLSQCQGRGRVTSSPLRYLQLPAHSCSATGRVPGRDIWVCIYPGVRCPAHIMDKWSGHQLHEHLVTLVRGGGHQFVRYHVPDIQIIDMDVIAHQRKI